MHCVQVLKLCVGSTQSFSSKFSCHKIHSPTTDIWQPRIGSWKRHTTLGTKISFVVKLMKNRILNRLIALKHYFNIIFSWYFHPFGVYILPYYIVYDFEPNFNCVFLTVIYLPPQSNETILWSGIDIHVIFILFYFKFFAFFFFCSTEHERNCRWTTEVTCICF